MRKKKDVVARTVENCAVQRVTREINDVITITTIRIIIIKIIIPNVIGTIN